MRAQSVVPTARDHRVAALLGAVLAGTVAALSWISSAGSAEYVSLQALRVADAQVASDSVIVSEPAGWQAGDPLALVIVAGPDRDLLRARLIADLLGARVAVAELEVAHDLQDPTYVVHDAYRTLAELTVDRAPGQVLLYGFAWDVGGHAALLAADEALRIGLSGADGARFAAHASLGTGCKVATPAWSESGEWRLHAIHQGETAWAEGDLFAGEGDADYGLTALACGMALVPGIPVSDPFSRLPARAAR